MKLRTYLLGSGSGLSALIAGCTDNTDGTENTDTPDAGDEPNGDEEDQDDEPDDGDEDRSEEESVGPDTDGPTIDDFTLSSREFAPGDVMEIDVEVTDDTGIEEVAFQFVHENGGDPVFVANRRFISGAGDGTYGIEFEWPADVPGGTYIAGVIWAKDSTGNVEYWTDAFSTEKKRIEVTSEITDTDGPTVDDFSLSDDEFEPGEVMEIDIDVTDETDIVDISIDIVHMEGGSQYSVSREYSPPVDDGAYTLEFEWPADAPGGTYKVGSIYTEDSLGNYDHQLEYAPDEERQVDVVSDSTDIEPPTIHDFSLSDDEFEPGEVMEIDVNVTDETDIQQIRFAFEHEDGASPSYKARREFSPPVDDGTYTLELEWSEDAPDGTYEAYWISARDSIGNWNGWTHSFSTEKKQVTIES